MVYAKDQWVQLPTKDLYDSQIMMASIGAAKDMYDKGVQEIKDYNNTYNNFYSPIGKDMDWYNKNIIQNAKDQINYLYDNGMDPTRTAEGRAAFARLVNNVPVGEIAKLKQSAEIAKEYLANKTKLQQQGLYSPDFEKSVLGGNNIEDWDTTKNGIWTRQSPSVYQSIDDIVEPWVKDEAPIYDAAYTKKQNDGFDYMTVTPQRISEVINDSLPEFEASEIGKFYKNKAIEQAGGDTEKGTQILKNWMMDRAKDHVRIERKENPYAMLRQQTSMDFAKMAKQHKYDMDELSYETDHAKSSSSGVESPAFSYLGSIYDKVLANAASSGTLKYYSDKMDVPTYDQIGKTLYNSQNAFGGQFIGNRMSSSNPNGLTSGQISNKFLNRYTAKGAGDVSQFLSMHGGKPTSGGNGVLANYSDISKIYSPYDIAEGTAGYRGPHYHDSSKLRKLIKDNGIQNVEIYPYDDIYGAIRKKGGKFTPYQKVRIAVKQRDGKLFSADAYYDLGYSSAGSFQDYNVGDFTTSGNRINRKSKRVTSGTTETNVFPNFDDWAIYGPKDTRANSSLHVSNEDKQTNMH